MTEVSDDFASSVVAPEAKQHWVTVLLVWLGFIIVVGDMAVGGGLASQMPRDDFFSAVFIGNGILAAFAVLAGYVGADSGKSFNQLMSEVFPGISWRIVSLYVPIVLIGWFAVEAAIFGNLVAEVLGLPDTARRLVMSGATLMFAVSSYIGFRAMGVVSVVAVPLIFLIGGYAIVAALQSGTAHFAFGATRLSLNAGIGIVMGSWIMGILTCLPDLTRFSRSRVSAMLVAAFGIFIGNSFSFLVGGSGAALVGQADPAKLLLSFGMIPLAITLALANIWTTNDNNMYSAALNVSRFANITRKQAVLICTAFAAVFAAFDPTQISVLFTFLIFMGNTAPALGGIVLGSYFVNRGRNRPRVSSPAAWMGWVVGSVAGTAVGGMWSVPTGFGLGFLVWYLSCVALERSQTNIR